MCILEQIAASGRQHRSSGLLILLLIIGAPTAWAQGSEDLRRQVEEASGFEQSNLLRRFYQRRGYELAWIAGGDPTSSAFALARSLRPAERDGFDPNEAHRAAVEQLLERVRTTGRLEPRAQTALDLQLTDAFLRYATFLLRGRVDPRTLHPGWSLKHRHTDLVAVLDSALQVQGIETALANLEPPHPAYFLLKQALMRYHRLAEQGGWGILTPGRALQTGDVGAEVRTLRERLCVTGDLPVCAGSVDRFDAALDRAVRAFQRRHGLVEDGIVGKETRAALNVPVEIRIRQIVLNLERLRWLPEDLGSRHLLINIAGYSLHVVEGGVPVLAMRVIVGSPRTSTPVFSTRLTEVVLAPYWHVPTSIARKEILPRVRRDPGYLVRNHMKLLTGGRLRQEPGPTNPLGRVKFTITNRYGVGLHDTPQRQLFAESACAFSHGCMRVEKPLELAAYVLRSDTTWTQERMEFIIERWQETRIAVPEPLPVHVLYWTAWVDDQGIVQFRPDIYGHDARLDHALQ